MEEEQQQKASQQDSSQKPLLKGEGKGSIISFDLPSSQQQQVGVSPIKNIQPPENVSNKNDNNEMDENDQMDNSEGYQRVQIIDKESRSTSASSLQRIQEISFAGQQFEEIKNAQIIPQDADQRDNMKSKDEMIYFELDSIIFKSHMSKAKQEVTQLTMQHQLAVLSSKHFHKNEDYFMSEERDKVIKVIPKNKLLSEDGVISFSLLKILLSLEGESEEITKIFQVASFIHFIAQEPKKNNIEKSDPNFQEHSESNLIQQVMQPHNENQSSSNMAQILFEEYFIIEISLRINTLYGILNYLDENQIPSDQLGAIFEGMIDSVLQLHSNWQVVNGLKLHSFILLSNCLFLVDFFQRSQTIDQSSLIYDQVTDQLIHKITGKDLFKEDIYQLGKCLLSLQMIGLGYQFAAIKEIFFEDINEEGFLVNQESLVQRQNMIIELAKKHNCNKYMIKTNKFIALEDGKIQLYQLPNILVQMTQTDSSERISSLKLALVCQKSHIFLRNVVYAYKNEFPPVVSDQETNKVNIFPFTPIQSIVSSDNRTVIISNEEEVFQGFLSPQGLPTEFCSIRIFQNFILEGFFMSEQRCLQAVLRFGDNVIYQGDCYNYVFRSFLVRTKTLEEVIISGMVQIVKTQNDKKVSNELNNVILAGKDQKVIKLNSTYVMEEKVFQAMESILIDIEYINLNNIDFQFINSDKFSIEHLQKIKRLSISVDSDQKASFLIKYLTSEYSQSLEVLDLSNSTKLDYQNYSLARLLGAQSKSLKLTTLIIRSCKSSTPSAFLATFFLQDGLKRITNLDINDTFIDSNFFLKLLDASFITSLYSLSLNDTQGVNENSLINLADRLFKFKNMKCLKMDGMLKRNFNKSLFSDSNISAFKKLAGQMNSLIFMETLVLDDSYINDAVLENLSKCSMPSLLKLYLRKQQRVTYKGLQYILQSSNFRNLKLINCNCSSSISLPKGVICSVEVSLLSCKTVTQQNISEYLRGNVGVGRIRFDAKHISTDTIASINLTKYLKKISILCSEQGDPAKVIHLLKCIDLSKRLQIVVNFHSSKSFISESDYESIGFQLYKRNQNIIQTQEFYNLLEQSLNSGQVNAKQVEILFIHRLTYSEFYSLNKNVETVEISSFMSLPIPTISNSVYSDRQKQNKQVWQERDLVTSRKRLNFDLNLILSNMKIKQNSLIISDNQDEFRSLKGINSKMQFLEDLKNLLSSGDTVSTWNELDLSSFCVRSDELHLISFSKFLSGIRNLILQNSFLKGNDLIFFSQKATSLQNLSQIDLTNNRLPIINGLIELIKSPLFPQLRTLKLGTFKIKILLKQLSSSFRKFSVLLSLLHNFPKFNQENKIKISVQNIPSNKQYLESLDFYIKRGINPPDKQTGGILKILMNSYTCFFIKNCLKFPDQAHNLHRLMRFQRNRDSLFSKEKESKGQEQPLTICITGHEQSGKKTIVESFLQSNFLDDGKLQKEMENNSNKVQNKLTSQNMGVKVYFTECALDKKNTPVIIKVLQSNPFFSQLRMSFLREADGICLVYDSSNKNLLNEMMQPIQEVKLLKFQKPVFIASNVFPGKGQSIKLVSNEINMFYETSTSNPISIKNLFSELISQSQEAKLRKPVFTNDFLTELSTELSYLLFDEADVCLDFLKVRNEVEFDLIRDFCISLKENESFNRINITLRNWGSHGKTSEDYLNKMSAGKVKVRISSALQAQKNE